MTEGSVKSCFDPEACSARGLSLDLLWALNKLMYLLSLLRELQVAAGLATCPGKVRCPTS